MHAALVCFNTTKRVGGIVFFTPKSWWFMIHMWLFHSITHKALESSPWSDSLKNIHLGRTRAPISQMSPLQGTLPPAHESTIICVFWRLALCGSDWLTDRWQAVLLLHLLSVQITATCSVITVCKGCSSICQQSNTLPLIAVKWTSSDVCRSWHSQSFLPPFRHPYLTLVSMLRHKISDEFWLWPQRDSWDMKIWDA